MKKSLMLTMSLVFMIAGLCRAEEAVTTTTTTTTTAAPADKDAMMAAMMKKTSPNENHQVLNPLAGTFKANVKFWMDPSAPAEESVGTSENKWIYNGRFIQQNFNGTSMGQPFEGMGFLGYDNIKGEYVSTWLDNMSTSIMMSGTGKYDAATKTIEQNGTVGCPMTDEKNRPYRTVLKIIDEDHHTYEMYMNDPKTNQELKVMEINYERVK
jgi:hypothetical protein